MRIYEVYNDHISLDVPIGLGYEHKIGKWALQTDLNVRFNLSHEFEGYHLGQDMKLQKNPDVFKKQIELIPFASVGIKYNCKNGLSLSLNPYIELKKWQVTKDRYPIDQKFRLYGLRTALMYMF